MMSNTETSESRDRGVAEANVLGAVLCRRVDTPFTIADTVLE